LSKDNKISISPPLHHVFFVSNGFISFFIKKNTAEQKKKNGAERRYSFFVMRRGRSDSKQPQAPQGQKKPLYISAHKKGFLKPRGAQAVDAAIGERHGAGRADEERGTHECTVAKQQHTTTPWSVVAE
jgi:hypothetical protein